MNGLFVTFEGPDGSGKSTQIRKLAGYLERKEIPCLLTHEPGGTVISDEIRALLLNPDHKEMKSETEVLLYAASRAQHVREKILPALEEGKVVLCDRFVDASIAYQGYGLGLDVERVREINDFATGGLIPNRSYFLDLSPETGRQRMLNRSELDRIEQKQLAYHDRVRRAFRLLYEENQKRICLLDGEEEKETLFSKIQTDFDQLWVRHQKEKRGVNPREADNGRCPG
ncbi:MAG TPA: dTMP kinase [Bacillales bacterium]|nr:dTMP kinase [Bacillales bacterium]